MPRCRAALAALALASAAGGCGGVGSPVAAGAASRSPGRPVSSEANPAATATRATSAQPVSPPATRSSRARVSNATWDTMFPWSVDFLPGGVGWVVGAHRLMRTVDDGLTWTSLSRPPGDEGVIFANRTEGYVWGGASSAANRLFFTDDGGRTWRGVGPPNVADVAISDAAVWVLAGPSPAWDLYLAPVGSAEFHDLGKAPTGRLIASGQRLYIDAPGGAGGAPSALSAVGSDGMKPVVNFPCTTRDRYTPASPLAVSPVGTLFTDCVAMNTATGATTNTAWTSSNQASTWRRRPSPPPGPVSAVAATGSALFVFGAQLLVDRGTGWTVALRPPGPVVNNVNGWDPPPDLGFADPTHGYLLTATGVLYLSSDAGRSWHEVRP